jgi:hypothetical protein
MDDPKDVVGNFSLSLSVTLNRVYSGKKMTSRKILSS